MSSGGPWRPPPTLAQLFFPRRGLAPNSSGNEWNKPSRPHIGQHQKNEFVGTKPRVLRVKRRTRIGFRTPAQTIASNDHTRTKWKTDRLSTLHPDRPRKLFKKWADGWCEGGGFPRHACKSQELFRPYGHRATQ